jgi:hypothetical protein
MEGLSYQISKIIEDKFKESPELFGKTLKEIADFFYKEGQASERQLRDALKAKVEHYRKAIPEYDDLAQADKTWWENVE